jgi:hypothetical protein
VLIVLVLVHNNLCALVLQNQNPKPHPPAIKIKTITEEE